MCTSTNSGAQELTTGQILRTGFASLTIYVVLFDSSYRSDHLSFVYATFMLFELYNISAFVVLVHNTCLGRANDL